MERLILFSVPNNWTRSILKVKSIKIYLKIGAAICVIKFSSVVKCFICALLYILLYISYSTQCHHQKDV